MDLKRIRQFVVLGETMNFHRAAERLHISQPPLSQSIKKLEDQLGAPLFHRHPRGVSLTAEGKEAMPLARELLRLGDRLVAAVQEAKVGTTSRIKLGSVASAAQSLLPPALLYCRQNFPKIDVSVSELTTSEIISGMDDQVFDMGLIRTPFGKSGKFAVEQLTREHMVLLARSESDLGAESTIDLAGLKNENFIGYHPVRAETFSSLMRLACFSAGFEPRITQEAGNIHTIAALVEGGLGLAMVPESIRIDPSQNLRKIPFTANGQFVEVGMALVMHRDDNRFAVSKLRETLTEQAKQFASDIARSNLNIGLGSEVPITGPS